MKITCLQENLARGLNTVSRAVSTRSSLPVLGNVLLETDNGRLKLSATNLEIVITCWIGAKVEEPGAITVPARIFSDLVNQLPQEQVSLHLHSRTNTLHVSCSRIEANVRGIDAKEFPLTPESDGAMRIRLEPADLKEMISQVVFAAATDDTRPTLTGIYSRFEGRQLKMVATDSFRLSVRTFELPEAVSQPRSVIIPARALSELARIMTDNMEYVDIIMPEGRNQIIFELEAARMVSQLVDGNFPDFGAVVPKQYRTRTVMGTANFLKACRTANIFARDANNIARVTVLPDNEGMPGFATISATSAETGDNVAQIDAAVAGDKVEMSFNVKYIVDALSVISEPQVALETTSTMEPGVIKPVGRDDFIHIIMPMQFGR